MPLGIRQKVILTSKSQAVCGRMGCSEANTVEMKCLGEEDAWNLFQYKAGVKITEDNAEIHKIAKLMVSACGGLPRTICSIGIGVARATCCGTDRYDWCIAYELFKANDLPSSGLDGVGNKRREIAGLQEIVEKNSEKDPVSALSVGLANVIMPGTDASEAHVSNLQIVSSWRQSSAGPSKRGKTAVSRTTAGLRRGLRSDKDGYVELALPNAPSSRKVPQVPLTPLPEVLLIQETQRIGVEDCGVGPEDLAEDKLHRERNA